MEHQHFQISWEQFHRDARSLARLLMRQGPFQGLIAVTRGGLVPAAIVARELDLRRIDTFCVTSYDSGNSPGEVSIVKEVSPEIGETRGEGMLIIDDLVDTGTTLRVIRQFLPKAHVATLYAKPLGRPFVDTFVTEFEQAIWVDFPWDLGLGFQAPFVKG